MSNASSTEPRLIRLSKILSMLDISRATWYRGIKSGRFPEPVKYGHRCARWRVEDIERLISAP